VSLLREGHFKAVSMRAFPNLRRTHEYTNVPSFPLTETTLSLLSLFISLLLSHLVEKKYFHGNVGTY
jgi:hypothetical protein